jgi:hypothetical protein
MTPRAKAFAAHVVAICEERRISIEYFDGAEFAWPGDRLIRIRPIKGDISYAAAMHEIGHVVGNWRTRPTLVCETGAWLWAEKNAVAWSDIMRAHAAKCLRSYLAFARQEKEYIPSKTHPFWRLAGY